MIAESLKLSVAADADLATSFDQLGILGGKAREYKFVFARPDGAPARVIIPRERFCALASGGRLRIEPGLGASGSGAAEERPAAIEATPVPWPKASAAE